MAVSEPTALFRVWRRLPVHYYTEIGRIISRFAGVEAHLFHLTNDVLGVGQKRGRLAIRKLRAAEQVTLIKDLLALGDLALPRIRWSMLIAGLREAQSYRDRVAHGVWIRHPAAPTPVLQDFSRAYIPGLDQGINPKIEPVAVVVPIGHLRKVRVNIDRLAKAVDQLETIIHRQMRLRQREQLRTWRETLRRRPPAPGRRSRTRDRRRS